jgi:hypothetical protein
MTMEDQRTCGKGLAEHSALPAKMGELTASVAENLELHMKALDLNDDHSKEEHHAYLELAEEHRKIAAQLDATAARMARYRDLPMGNHDQKAMTAPKVLATFERFVNLEQELLALLQKRLDQDRKMLTEIREAGSGSGSH